MNLLSIFSSEETGRSEKYVEEPSEEDISKKDEIIIEEQREVIRNQLEILKHQLKRIFELTVVLCYLPANATA